MIRLWAFLAGLGGLFSVAAGAASAHLEASEAHAAALLRTGALYGLVHAAALLAVVAMAERRARPGLPLSVAGCGFAAGIVLFSFSLFALALTGIARFSVVTPFGGVAMLIGWAALALGALACRSR
ncbi:MAG TPA: DUF423 domain-containing protein [Stellaceae bacterium]|nr:DUF423 domain-containing protein [Stellaceae bacterium]